MSDGTKPLLRVACADDQCHLIVLRIRVNQAPIPSNVLLILPEIQQYHLDIMIIKGHCSNKIIFRYMEVYMSGVGHEQLFIIFQL